MQRISLFHKTPNNLDDIQLVSKIKQGDDWAFEVLYERYNKALYNYIWTILNFDKEEAALVLSDVFIKAYKYIQENKIEHIKPILYKISHNTSIDRIKTQKNSDFSLGKIDNDPEDYQDTLSKKHLDIDFKKKLLQKYLGQLDEKYRSVIYLNYYENKSYEEIAQIQNSNKNSIGTLVFQGKKKLEDLLKKDQIDTNIFLL